MRSQTGPGTPIMEWQKASGISIAMVRGGGLVGVEIDGLGVDQEAIHVEKDGLDGFREHGFVLSLRRETSNQQLRAGRKIHAHP